MKKIVCILLIVMLIGLTACGDKKTTLDEEVYKDDIQDYISEILDPEAKIQSFEQASSETADDTLTTTCNVVYGDSKNETAGTFTLTYCKEGNGWILEKCHVELDGTMKGTYLTELQCSSHVGKIWTSGNYVPEYEYDTIEELPDCWQDIETPGHVQMDVADNANNPHAYGIYVDKKGTATTCSITYNLAGEYTVFTGTCAYPANPLDPERAGKYTKYFEIYGDGELLYTSPIMDSAAAPDHFSLDVTEVQHLTIMYPATGGPNDIATLFDGALQ